MLIDATHKKWALGFAVGTAVGASIYLPYARFSPQGARGGSALGITFGVLAFGLMLFAGLLGARKKVPAARLGRLQNWMRGHLWLGLLSLPLVIYHAGGFTWGAGPLTRWLMILTVTVIASGVFGAVLQHFLPRLMTREVPMETIYEQIGAIREQLQKEASDLLAAAEKMLSKPAAAPAAAPAPAAAAAAGGESPAAAGAAVATAPPPAAPAPAMVAGLEALQEFAAQELMPFLQHPNRRAPLGRGENAARAFRRMRTLLPPSLHGTLDDLASICEEERQLMRQQRLHAWLHGWLLLHVPLSYGLLVLVAIHAVMALRY